MSKQWWQDKVWKGVMAAAPRAPRRMATGPFRPCKPFSWVADPVTKEPWIIPSESQNGDSCAAHTMLNWEEAMLRRFVGRKTFKDFQQLDGDAAYVHARKMFHFGNLNGGLYFSEAFAAALDMGIFAPGSVLMTIPRREALYSDQFERTPYMDGQDVAGWMNHGTNPENGQIYEGPGSDGSAGHAMLDVSRMPQVDCNFLQKQNSWGPKFGWNGLLIQSEFYDDMTGLEDVKYYVQQPEGWEQWDGWKKWVIGR